MFVSLVPSRILFVDQRLLRCVRIDASELSDASLNVEPRSPEGRPKLQAQSDLQQS